LSKETQEYPDGSRYQGEMQDGKREGEGVLIRADGTKYKGQWKNNVPEGLGTIIWPDGSQFKGYWKSGKRHGKGVEISPGGNKIEGIWEEGELKEEITDSAAEEFTESKAPPKRKPFRGKSSLKTESLQEQGKGFFAALVDTSFSEMVTPKIIKVLFIIGLIGIALGALAGIVGALFGIAELGATALLSIIAVPIGAIIAVIFLRVYMELIILLFNIYDRLKNIDRGING